MRTVIVLQHIEVEKPGLILDALFGSGLDIDIRNLANPRLARASRVFPEYARPLSRP
ncbi:hypothetical protein [Streptomyces sp. NPDC001070]